MEILSDVFFMEVVATPRDRNESAGIYLIWHPTDAPEIRLDIVKGYMPRANLATFVANGNYDDSASYRTWQIDGGWAALDEVGKYGQMQISGKKDGDWQKWYWYAVDAKRLGASKSEDPSPPDDWIGAWWSAPGVAATNGIHDLAFWYWDNQMTGAQRTRTIGIRISQNAIGVEGEDPGPNLDDLDYVNPGTGRPAYERGAVAGPKPVDYSDSLSDGLIAQAMNRVLDKAFPDSDDDAPVYPLLIRPTMGSVTTSLGARMNALWNADKIGLVITSADFEPSNAGHVRQSTKILEVCKREGGNTRAFAEGFGRLPGNSKIDGRFSILQHIYWTILFDLHIGVSWLGIRDEYVGNYDLAGAVGDEWRAALDFAAKYAGYQQFPAASPGAWVALREGHRMAGNYDFLASQIVSGGGARGTELWAGSEGDSFPYPSSDYVGAPSSRADQNSTVGIGQRQSLWAFAFRAGENLEVQLDTTFANAINGRPVVVRVHYLDDAPGATFDVSAFGDLLGTVDVQNTTDWKIAEFPIATAILATDADGAHVVVTPAGGTVRIHMVEVSRG